MFAYCGNNPVNRLDPSGQSWLGAIAIALGTTFALPAAVATVITYAVAAVAVLTVVAIVDVAVQEYRNHHVNYAEDSNDSGETTGTNPPGSYAPDRELPRTKHGDPIPDTDVPHTQLGKRTDDGNTYNQAREWLAKPGGKGITANRDFDFSDHGDSEHHENPHQHKLTPNNPNKAPRGGYRRGDPMPWDPNS